MNSLHAPSKPLTIYEQLDAMLLSWLERHVERHEPGSPALRAKAVVPVAASALPELEKLCAAWGMTMDLRATVAVIEGPALAVEGFAEVTQKFRR